MCVGSIIMDKLSRFDGFKENKITATSSSLSVLAKLRQIKLTNKNSMSDSN